MKPDPLNDIFREWQPKSPHRSEDLVQDTLRKISQVPRESVWQRLEIFLEESFANWLPSPRVLLPVAASLVLLAMGLRWTEAGRLGESLAALQWRQELNQPLSKHSIAGAYAALVEETVQPKK
jgi:hypothetical protein